MRTKSRHRTTLWVAPIKEVKDIIWEQSLGSSDSTWAVDGAHGDGRCGEAGMTCTSKRSCGHPLQAKASWQQPTPPEAPCTHYAFWKKLIYGRPCAGGPRQEQTKTCKAAAARRKASEEAMPGGNRLRKPAGARMPASKRQVLSV
eukprot:scaffold25393_cov28-Prasinocladus_malaysianus.AAC.1